MRKILLVSILSTLVMAGIIFLQGNNYLEKEIERALYSGYPGTEKVEAEIDIAWLKDGFRGNIKELRLSITNWAYNDLEINRFRGEFINTKINLPHLLRKKTIVVEKIAKGNVWLEMDQQNLNKMAAKKYAGIEINLQDNKITIAHKITFWGRDLATTIWGTLVPGQGPGIIFKPGGLILGGLKPAEGMQEKILKNFNLQFQLEKIPFTFQVTTVKIMQNKILIEGKV
ncbi:MAG: hypothetical protein ACOWWO_01540 [Peptococcaceae bacterium]